MPISQKCGIEPAQSFVLKERKLLAFLRNAAQARNGVLSLTGVLVSGSTLFQRNKVRAHVEGEKRVRANVVGELHSFGNATEQSEQRRAKKR